MTTEIASKLTPEQKAELRAKGLKLDGTPRKSQSGLPKPRTGLSLGAVRTALEVFGIDAIAKLYEKHGSDLRRPLASYVKSLDEGSAARANVGAVLKQLFPRVGFNKGFKKLNDTKIGKYGRAVIDVSAVGQPGQRVKTETLTLPDGRQGLFVTLSAASTAPVWTA